MDVIRASLGSLWPMSWRRLSVLADVLPDRLQATFWPGGRIPADGHVALWGTSDPAGAAVELGLPPGEPASLPTVLRAEPNARRRVAQVAVPARVVPIRSAARALAAMRLDWPAWQGPGDSVLAWSVAAKLALEHVAAGHLVPTLRAGGPGEAIACWRLAAVDDARMARLAAAMPPAAHALHRDEDDETVWTGSDLLAAFCDAVADSCARVASPTASVRAARTSVNGRIADRRREWVTALSGDEPVLPIPDDALVDDVAKWAAALVTVRGVGDAQLCVQLHTPDASAAYDGEPGWPLVYHLSLVDDPSVLVPATQVWADGSSSLKLAARHLAHPQESLVKGLAEAARLFHPSMRACQNGGQTVWS